MLPASVKKHLLLWIIGLGGIVFSALVVWALKDRLDAFGRRNETQGTLNRLAQGLRAHPLDPRGTEVQRRLELAGVAQGCLSPEAFQNGRVYDAWNRVLRFEFDRLGGVEARSAGEDGKFGTDDDLMVTVR
jgi:hypothetical protein